MKKDYMEAQFKCTYADMTHTQWKRRKEAAELVAAYGWMHETAGA